jgi:hypothetical protein
MPERELHGRGGAGGGGHDRRALDAERVQQAGVRVRLRGCGSVLGQGRAKLAEPRHRDDAKASPDERLADPDPLVESPSGTVHEEDR